MASYSASHQLARPFEVDTLLEIRVSKMKTMPGLKIQSGIDKQLCPGPIQLGKLGLEGDEHDPTFHGGPDKAILGYCAAHYPGWQHAYPDRTQHFVPGGFGENFVTAHMNERNVCIGDVISVVSQVLLQVSLPRQPCFKLNHRFSIKDFAPVTHQTSRTGWYYRVLREGTVRPGDAIRLIERKWPEWTVELLQEYLHRDKDNLEMNKRLAQLDVLGEESRAQFRKRVASANKKLKPLTQDAWKDWRIVSRKRETPRILSIILERVASKEDVEQRFPGTHARFKLPNGLIRLYSIVASGDDIRNLSNRMEFGIAFADESRGGSRYLHETAKIGDILQVGRITTDLDAVSSASHHCFIVGGIGLTAFLALIKVMHSINLSYVLHYAVRSAQDVPFRDRLEPFKENMVLYDKSKGQRMDIGDIVKTLTWNSQVYVCGPNRMEAARRAVEDCGIPPNEVHYEAFSADTSGDAFEAVIANKADRRVAVGEEKSLLEALRREDLHVPSSCEVGNCGTCKVTLQQGRVQHRGTALISDERDTSMLSCVSRGIGSITIEI